LWILAISANIFFVCFLGKPVSKEEKVEKVQEKESCSSYDFEDTSTWSDHSAVLDDTSVFTPVEENQINDETLQEASSSPNTPPQISSDNDEDLPPPKRIVSKMKTKQNDGEIQVGAQKNKNLIFSKCMDLTVFGPVFVVRNLIFLTILKFFCDFCFKS
jgi:hypothetical protein